MSMINHDLRNPVAAMQAVIETASIDQEYAENQFIEDLKSSLSLQNTLISSLLDMARLGESIDDYDVEDSYPIDLVQQCVRRQQMSPLGKNRKLEIDVPDTLPAVRCDPVQMGRVFDNLVSNALKYSDGATEITASVDESTKQPDPSKASDSDSPSAAQSSKPTTVTSPTPTTPTTTAKPPAPPSQSPSPSPSPNQRFKATKN
jgi:signal transduction histidine kinase